MPRAERLLSDIIIAARFLTKNCRRFAGLEKHLRASHAARYADGAFAAEIPVPVIDRKNMPQPVVGSMVKAQVCPLHFPGFAVGCAAVQLWNSTFFKDQYGADVVPAIDGDHYDEMTLSDVVDMIRRGEKTHQKYVQAVADIFCKHRELFDHLPMGSLFSLQKSGFHGAELFMGARGTGSPWHAANEWTFFVNVAGRKQWRFIRPEFTLQMRPLFQKDLIYVVSEFGNENPPGISTYTVTLEPGDLLIFPAWWWHRVVNLSEETIGVAVRFRTLMQQIKSANPTLSMLQLTTLQQWKNILLERTTGRFKDDERYLWRALKMIG